MSDTIQIGQMVFLRDGAEGVGAVRQLEKGNIIVYVENAGDFALPRSAVTGVHSGKVMLDAKLLPKAFLTAVGHAHDREDPKLVG